jgi:zinc transport system ATP-binding protein
MSVVNVSHLAAGYEGREVLRDITLRVQGGEVVAILGANGSGKSTLIRTVLGLVPITRGDVELFGTGLRRFRQWARVGYVPQRLGAGGGVPATVGEVVSSGRLARRGIFRPPGASDKAAVRDALTDVGLLDRIHDPVSTLSGGQQQRTLIARALAGRPDLLVLDEPTVGLDPVLRRDLWELFHRLADGGATVLVSSHVMDEAERCDRLLLLHEGGLLADATPAELRARTGAPSLDAAFLRLVEGAS